MEKTWITEDEALELTGMTRAELKRRQLTGEIRTADAEKIFLAVQILDNLDWQPPETSEQRDLQKRLTQDINDCSWRDIAIFFYRTATQDYTDPILPPN